MEELITLSINANEYDSLKSWQLASWCRKQGADEWTLAAMAMEGTEKVLSERFAKKTKPFRLPAVKRQILTVHGSSSQNNFIQSTELWRLDSASFTVLQEFMPDGLFTYHVGNDEWFEDPVFYRQGEFMLGVVSHEEEGIIRVTKAEHHLLKAEGFAFRPRGSYVGY